MTIQSYKSIFGKYEVNETEWVISYFNRAATIKGKFTGHSVLLIEGIENGQKFIRQCDIGAIPIDDPKKDDLNKDSTLNEGPLTNKKGIISKIRIYSSYYKDQNNHPNTEQYKSYANRSWKVLKTQALQMLRAIEIDEIITENAKKGIGSYLPYQYAGNKRMFNDDQGHNCPTWCFEKLATAGIHISTLPMDNIKTMPQKHVKPGAEIAEKLSPCVIV